MHIPHGQPIKGWVDLEQGGDAWFLDLVDRWVEPRHVDGQLVGEATLRLPPDLPLGWHTLWAQTQSADGEISESSMVLVVTPERLDPPALRDARQWGFMTQLYSMRSARSWGSGDLVDLAELVAWSGGNLGADFVLVNPMHAASPVHSDTWIRTSSP